MSDKDIRLIIRPDRRIKVRTMGTPINYHIVVIAEDQVMVKHWSKRCWHYSVISIADFELWHKLGRLS